MFRRKKQDEAGEVLGVILNRFAEDDGAVMSGGAASGDGGVRFISTLHHLANAAGSIFGGDALESGMGHEEAFALGESHGMGSNGAEVFEARSGTGHEVMFNGKNGFTADFERAFEEQVVDADDRPGKGVLDGDNQSVGGGVGNGLECGIERGTGHGFDLLTKKLDGGSFAEGTGFALEGDAHVVEV